MGLFSKRPDPSDVTDEAQVRVIPVASTVPNQPPPGRSREVRVTPADPTVPPSQSIERRAPADGGVPTAPVTSGPPPIPQNAQHAQQQHAQQQHAQQQHAQPAQAHAPVNIPPVPGMAKFGIEDAMRLLREMPGRDTPVVRDAVQRTLEFMHVDLDRLVEDARAKDATLENRAMALQREVEQHEALALAARKQIAAIEGERAELEATKCWMLEHRGPPSEPIPLDRVVRGSPHS